MFELFTAMFKEEWRIHTTLFGTTGFVLFPLLLTFFALAGGLFWPFFSDVVPAHTLVVLTHYSFVLAGMSVGAFGLFGREVMNRRFGQASMIAYSSRSLPVSEQGILLNFFLKDTAYYLLLWVAPFIAGVALAMPFNGLAFTYIPRFILSLSLSFLIGLAIAFILSTLYVHSPRLLLGVLLTTFISAALIVGFGHVSMVSLLPSLEFFFTLSGKSLITAIVLITVLCALSIRFVRVDYRETTQHFTNALDGLASRFPWSPDRHFIAKDVIDLSRSEGGIGKIIFSFLLPVAFIWIALFVLMRFIPNVNILVTFSILLGVISSTIYNWVTEFDLFTSYAFLPIEVSTVMRAKLQSYGLLNLVSFAILIAAAFGTGQYLLLFPALVSFVSVSFYAVAVTIFFTGLSPSIMLYNAKVYGPYLGLVCPVLLLLIFLAIPNPWFVVASTFLVPISWYLLHRGFNRWSLWQQPNF